MPAMGQIWLMSCRRHRSAPPEKTRNKAIEVQGEPSALFLPANDEALEERNWTITLLAEDRSIHSPLPLFALALVCDLSVGKA
jgi:hypothetical protein